MTPYADSAPSDPRHAAASEYWHGNVAGDIWAGVSHAYDNVWTAPYVGLVWWRDDPSALSVTIQRAGDDSEPILAFVMSEHDPFRPQHAGMTFPEAGCWEVTAANDSSELRFTVEVMPSNEVRLYGYTALLEDTGGERETLLATPVPNSCAGATWAGPDFRTGYAYRYPWYLDGDGLSLGSGHGVLFTGANDIVWLAGGGISPEEQLRGPGTITAELLDGAGATLSSHELPVEVRQQLGSSWPAGSGIRHAWITTLSFPEAGCWHIQAGIGEHTLDAVIYVHDLP